MISLQEERTISYHTVTLGELTRAGDALAEINEINEAGEQETRLLRVPAGLPGERVTIAVEAPPKPRTGKRSRRWKSRPPRVWITEIHDLGTRRCRYDLAPHFCKLWGGRCRVCNATYDRSAERWC